MAVKERLEDQVEEIEERYEKLMDNVRDQLKDLEDRYEEFLDNIQDDLPENAADVMKRAREANTDMRKRLVKMSEQITEATRDALEAIGSAGRRATGRNKKAPAKKSAKKPPAKKKVAAKKATPAKKATSAKKSAPKKAAATSTAPSAKWTKAELYEEATRLDIAGRSGMSKGQLLTAVKKAG